MDLTILELATEITAILIRVRPYLANMSEKAAEEASKNIGSDVLEGAKSLWRKLCPKVEAKGAAQEALNDVIVSPENEDAQEALRLQIENILSEDESFAKEISSLWEEIKPSYAKAIAIGDRSVAIGRNANCSVIVTGDNNQVR